MGSNKHIINLLDEKPLSGLSEAEMAAIRTHVSDCAKCEKAFEAVRVSEALLRERAMATHEPSAFFQTRVLAVLRERQAGNEVWNFGRLWRATGALASSMIATVAALAVLTFLLPAETNLSPETVSVNRYSAEAVILNQSAEELQSDSQVLTTLYGPEEDVVR